LLLEERHILLAGDACARGGVSPHEVFQNFPQPGGFDQPFGVRGLHSWVEYALRFHQDGRFHLTKAVTPGDADVNLTRETAPQQCFANRADQFTGATGTAAGTGGNDDGAAFQVGSIAQIRFEGIQISH